MLPDRTHYQTPLSQDPVWRQAREPPPLLSQRRAAPAYWQSGMAEEQNLPPSYPQCPRPDRCCQHRPSELLALHDDRGLVEARPRASGQPSMQNCQL